MVKKQVSGVKLLVAALIIIGLVIIIANPGHQFFGMAVLSLDKVTYQTTGAKWTIEASHNPIIVDSLKWYAASLKDSPFASNKPLLLEESNYQVSCNFDKGQGGSAVTAWYSGGDYKGGLLYAPDMARVDCIKSLVDSGNIALDGRNIVRVSGYQSHPWDQKWYACYYTKPFGTLYPVSAEHPFVYHVNLTVSSDDGKKATVSLTQDVPTGDFITATGENLGRVTEVGGLLSMRSQCVAPAANWFESADTNTRYFANGINTDAKSYMDSCMVLNQQGTATLSLAEVIKKCYDYYQLKSVVNAVEPINKGYFTNSSTYVYTPTASPVNLVYRLQISADWIKVVESLGKPRIDSVSTVKDTINNDDKATVNYRLCNDALTGSGSFLLSLKCDQFSQSFGDSPLIPAGQCVEGSISTIASCEDTAVTAKCDLVATGLDGTSTMPISFTCNPNPINKCTPSRLYCNKEGTQLLQCDADGIGKKVVDTCNCTLNDKGAASCPGGNGGAGEGEEDKGWLGSFNLGTAIIILFAAIFIILIGKAYLDRNK